ncbi:MAG: tRNA (N6-isopentenyl adenosine(37)-C2)-methylthiotransferase MiaB [Catonella sp.]|uniref:tRNA (N6-isopentenyl adenosine(37)-C2)-methylthiotransferase MiaB n=1 Tax=Catonella sp. TaxID=2382125 RepID=UPI003F9ED3B4
MEDKITNIFKVDYDFEAVRAKEPTAEPDRQYYYMEKAAEVFKLICKNAGKQLTFNCNTFGCQMNFRDSEKIAGILEKIGFTGTEDKSPDFVILNTCTIRENADQKVYGNLGYLKKLKELNPNMIIALCGCMMQETTVVQKLRESYSFIDLIYGTHNIYKLAELVFAMFAEKSYAAHHPVKKNGKYKIKHSMLVDIWKDTDKIVEDLPDERKYSFKASVNITYGCDNFCTYCIVPYVRGRERSRRPEDIIKEVQCLAKSGVLEIMLLGQNVNSYGKGLSTEGGEPVTFAKLLKMVEKVEGIKRIRFMTPHPKDFSDELIEVIAESDKVCRHIHLPFQAGSNNVLKRMNRRYTKEGYLELTEKIKKRIPDIALTTDIIVGFPGETEEDFEDTLDVVRKVHYQSAYMFEYSKRTGTPAATMTDQVEIEAVKRRFKRLQDTVAEYSDDKFGSQVGQIVEVLAEEVNSEVPLFITGRMSDNTLVHFKVPTNKKEDYIGKLLKVKITENCRFYLMGEL